MTTFAVEARSLSKDFPGPIHALEEVSLRVSPGEMLAIIGSSGAGKSTFLRCINRLVEPTSGQVLVNGRDVTHIGGSEFRRLRVGIGMIFQQFNLVKRLSVLKNVLTGRLGYTPAATSWLHRFSPADLALAYDCLRRVGIEDKALARADTLSGGQQQRVAIARALAQQPQIMLADEPVASLDPETSRAVLDDLRRINREDGITTIVNLHQLEYAREYADRVVALRAGRVLFDGKPGDIDRDVYQAVYVG